MTPSSIHPRIWIGLGLVLFAIIFWGGVLRHNNTLTIRDDLSEDPSWLRENISEPVGSSLSEALMLLPGQTRRLVYDISIDPEAHCLLRLSVAEGVNGSIRAVWSIDGVPGDVGWDLIPGRGEIDLTPHLPPTGLVRLAIDASLPLGSNPTHAVEWIEISTSAPRTINWHGLIFLFVLSATIWVGLPTLLISEAAVWWDRTWLRVGLIAIGIAGALLLMPTREAAGAEESLITGPKYFDDIRAISNSALMISSGGDTDQLYFRSRLRPAYVAHTMPLVIIWPQGMIRVQHGPGIFSNALWREFDRLDGTFGTFRFLEISIVAWLEGIALTLTLALIWRRLGCGVVASWLAATLAIAALSRVLYNPLTIIWNLLIAAAAVLAVIRLLDKPALGRALLAGLILAACALTKVTALMAFAPLAVLWMGRMIGQERDEFHSRLRLALIALVVGAMITLWWFEGFLGGLHQEMALRRAQIPFVMEMHPEFPRRSLEVVKEALWALAEWGWILVALGLTLGIRLPRLSQPQCEADGVWFVSREGWTFALLWALAGAMVFLMPFTFPRFLKYMAPGLGLIAASGVCTGVWWCLRWSRPKEPVSDQISEM